MDGLAAVDLKNARRSADAGIPIRPALNGAAHAPRAVVADPYVLNRVRPLPAYSSFGDTIIVSPDDMSVNGMAWNRQNKAENAGAGCITAECGAAAAKDLEGSALAEFGGIRGAG